MQDSKKHILHVVDHYFPEGRWRESGIRAENAVLGWLSRSEFEETLHIVVHPFRLGDTDYVKAKVFTKNMRHEITTDSSPMQNPELAVLGALASFIRKNRS